MSTNNPLFWFPYALFMLSYIFILPGYSLTVSSCKETGRLKRLAISLSLGIVVIPIASFAAAMVMGTVVNITLLLAISSIFNLWSLLKFLKRKLK